jgi:hypothetical protein
MWASAILHAVPGTAEHDDRGAEAAGVWWMTAAVSDGRDVPSTCCSRSSLHALSSTVAACTGALVLAGVSEDVDGIREVATTTFALCLQRTPSC